MKQPTHKIASVSKPSAFKALRYLPLLGCLTLLACATLKPEEQVRQRATDRWAALVAQDFGKAYSFAPPAYRQLHTADDYKKTHQAPVKWISGDVIRVGCEQEKCEVRVALQSQPVLPFGFKQTLTTGLDETWVFEDGNWWMFEPL